MVTATKGGRRLKETVLGAQPLVSIIIVVFRAAQELPPLLDSVFQLLDETVELIVVDGGSDDGTCEILREHDSKIHYWISEPDHGIYDAMNKGIAAARGVYLFHLNAGDSLLSIPRQELQDAAANKIEVVAFRVSIDGRYEFKPSQGVSLRLNNTLHHQGTFFLRETFPEYDIRYKVFADFDVNQRLALRGAEMVMSDRLVALHTTGGISNASSRSTNAEFFRVIQNNYGVWYVPAAWLLCKWRGFKSRFGLNP
jgi:glycosyltransferase involved in cell wall biosynthesis